MDELGRGEICQRRLCAILMKCLVLSGLPSCFNAMVYFPGLSNSQVLCMEQIHVLINLFLIIILFSFNG